jgi:hypothetical protein
MDLRLRECKELGHQVIPNRCCCAFAVISFGSGAGLMGDNGLGRVEAQLGQFKDGPVVELFL